MTWTEISRLLVGPSLVAVTKEHHGLGNRVRVVLGAHALADSERRRFYFTWPVGRSFGARLDELWTLPTRLIAPIVSKTLSLRYPYRDSSLRWLDDRVRSERVLQIRTPHALDVGTGVDSWQDRLRALTPTDEIRDVILRTFAEELGGGAYVGVMVRAHPVSHAATLERSPIGWFVERMRAIRRIWPDMKFFVSADTPDAFDALKTEFPDICGRREKGLYNSADALRAAVVDLYLLGSSTHLLGAHYSSFPEMAQALGGPKLDLETSVNARSALLESSTLSIVINPLRPFERGVAS
ncbi:hypothetical protein E6C70_14350 [Glaciibacter flavus]|uniref:Uncharacterized protein n=1 Tax=Orlajensenia flava TaxID=2565934 RepID=A0A4V6RZ09_9MICO|nr:hypothetical protein [Glaciibacter flavus]THG30547.1 hypothetical protein E6C70_14350 [Glaciibacter flavus]